METHIPNQNQNNKTNPLYFLIAGLVALLFLQFFFFSSKVKSVQKELKAVSAESESPAGFRADNFRNSSGQPFPNSAAMAHMNHLFDEDPFAALDRIHSRLNNMMNTARTYAPVVMQQMNRDLSSDFIPAVDMEETDKTYIVRADIPGLEKDKINITAENNILIIQGVRENHIQHADDQSGVYTTERSYGSFARTVAMPGPVDESGIKAAYKDGVLTIEVPKEKGQGSNSKQIPVQ